MANNIKNSGKNVYVVHFKTSMLIVERTDMLYIRYHKFRLLKVALCNKLDAK